MKKRISIILAVVMALLCLAACGQNKSKYSSKNDKIKVITTIFPEYDWVREIAGENSNVDITMLLDNGVDLHSYQPTAEDIMKISSCDMFIYVGGESDEWVEDALKESVNKNMKVINLMDVLKDTVKTEEAMPGMQSEEMDNWPTYYPAGMTSNEIKEDMLEHEEKEYDEHVWLSLRNAEKLCDAITDSLCDIDSENKNVYSTNAAVYKNKLKELDDQYQNVVKNSTNKTLLFGDRFPFRYMVDDYGLKYYAAFAGCSAESEASFETISFLAKKVDELGLKNVMTIEKSDKKIANTIISNTNNKNQKIFELNSLQSTTSKDVKNGVTYLSVMKSNLNVLKEALQ